MATVIAVAFLKGGTGKSVLAANLAALLARAGRRTLLLDADEKGDALAAVAAGEPGPARAPCEEGSANEAPAGGTGDSRAPREAKGCPGLHVAAGFDAERAREIGQASPAWDAVVVDCPAEDGAAVRAALAAADVVLLPAPDQPRVGAAVTRTIDLLRRSTPSGKTVRVWLVRTRVPRRRKAEPSSAKAASVPPPSELAAPEVPRLPVDVPEDDAVPRALAAGRPLVDHAPRSRAARAHVELSRVLLPLVEPIRGEEAHDRIP